MNVLGLQTNKFCTRKYECSGPLDKQVLPQRKLHDKQKCRSFGYFKKFALVTTAIFHGGHGLWGIGLKGEHLGQVV